MSILTLTVIIILGWTNLFSQTKDACYFVQDELHCLYRVPGVFSVTMSDIDKLIDRGIINKHLDIIQRSPQISLVKLSKLQSFDDIITLSAVSVKNGEILALTGELGLVFKPETTTNERNEIIRKNGLTLKRTLDGIDGYGVYSTKSGKDPFDLSVKIFETGKVKWAQPVWLEEPQLNSTPNDIYYPDQWHHPVINSEKAWNITKGHPDAKIAVLDSGVDTTHPDLRLAWGHSFVPTEQYVDPNMGAFQNQYIMAHGTCVSGIAAAIGFNEWGVAGVCADCTVIPVKYIGLEQNYPSLDRKLHAMKWAVDEGAWVINNSWVVAPDTNRQTEECIEVPSDNFLIEAVDYAVNNGRNGLGTIIVWAAGNSTCDTILNKSLQDDRTVSVSGLDTDLTLVYYSNHGVAVDIAAPAGDSMPDKGGLVTTDVSTPNKGFNPAYNNANNEYNDFSDQLYTRYFDGTSAAAPVVSGAIALMLTAKPGMTYQEAISCMKSAASEPDATCQHGEKESCFGAGILDVGKMVEMAFNGDCGGDEVDFCLNDSHCKENEICDFETKSCIPVSNDGEELSNDNDNNDDSFDNNEDSQNNPDSSDDHNDESSNSDNKESETDKNIDEQDTNDPKENTDDENIGCTIIVV
jgi:subtilisin family serine protease